MLNHNHQRLGDRRTWRWLVGVGVVMSGAYVLGRYDFLLFHTVVEWTSCVVACAVFMILWNVRRHLDSGFYLILGVACLAMGVLDLVHVLAYREISIFPGLDENASISAKTMGRWITGVSFLVAPLFLHRRVNATAVLATYVAAIVVAMVIILTRSFPDCYRERLGMTSFQQVSRGVSGMVFLVAAWGIFRRRSEFDIDVFPLLLACWLSASLSECLSAISPDFSAHSKVFAHLLQLLSVLLLYETFLDVGLTKPQEVLFRSLKKSEERLLRLEREKEAILNGAEGVFIYLVDSQKRILWVNDAVRNLPYVQGRPVAGEYCYKLLHGRETMCENCNAVKAWETGQTLQREVVTQDGRTVLVHSNPIKGEDGTIVSVVHIGLDVTERKLADERRSHSLARLEAVNRLEEELILPSPIEDKFKKITEAAVRLLDLDFCRIWTVMPGDLCDSGCSHAHAAEPAHQCRRHCSCLHLMASSGRYTNTDGTHRRVPLGAYKIGRIAAGTVRKMICENVATDPNISDHEWARRLGMVSFAGYRLHDARGNVIGVLGMFAKRAFSEEDDVFLSNLAETTSKVIIDYHAAEELRQAQKLEGVGQLAGGIAHEFNNLLQAIGGYTSYAMQGLSPTEERYNDLEQVLKASERATVLTRQLLGFSRRRAIQPKSTDANALVHDLVRLAKPAVGAHISLELALRDDVGTVYADPGELQQALLNLCINARDAMPSGGTLTLRTETAVVVEPFWDAHFDVKPGRYVVFAVSDTGCGIPHDIQQRIFEPFFTTKDVGKGTGLGLALVYGIVRQHHGAIYVYSEVGKGATFKLYLPVATESSENTSPEALVAGPGGTEAILIAEDDPGTRSLASRMLTTAGYTVLAASDGQEAIRMFEANWKTVSLVMLDAVMPKLTGHQVYDRIQKTHPGAKVLLCTGYDREAIQPKCQAYRDLPMIEKPFTTRTLLLKVREVLDGPAAAEAP